MDLFFVEMAFRSRCCNGALVSVNSVPELTQLVLHASGTQYGNCQPKAEEPGNGITEQAQNREPEQHWAFVDLHDQRGSDN